MGDSDNRQDPDSGKRAGTPDADATEINPEGSLPGEQAPEPEAPAGDYTEYQSATQTSAGFDQARQLAQKARSESGRLLKKRFVLEDVLGEGGMGLVYKARDLRKVEAEDRNPYIAVKVLGQNFKDHPQAFVSLQQEAVKSQKLAHPNIVTVHDFDRDGATIFMTMELLKGDPLDSLLRLEAPFSKEVAMRYFNDLCSGLDYAHKRGLIHSDFKPGNIFVTTGGTVKILDFGIARAANKSAVSHDYDAGDLGALTPAYATVEMARGEPPSFSDDVYALACVLYIMLTGEHPYDRKSAADALAANMKPARPALLNNREWQALSAALSPEKSRRPATIDAFRNAMLPAKRGGNIKAIVALGLVLVVAAGGWLYYQQLQAEEEQQRAIDSRMQVAKDCFYSDDYKCAIENALVVRSLAPQNSEAGQLLAAAEEAQAEAQQEQLVSTRLADAEACFEAADYDCAGSRLRALLDLVPGQAQAILLLQRVDREVARQTIARHLQEASACIAGDDIDCARAGLASAREAGAEPGELAETQRQVDGMAEALMAAARDREERLGLLLAEGRACLRMNDFACADDRAAQLKSADPGNAGALELEQAAAAGREQQRFREQTVAAFLQEAEDCFQRKNYSCTIAKSESALAIIPRHPGASALIQKADGAQNKAKMNISIQ
ncbi:serine/threonine-protein kinase [Haliea sp. E1-2-M8]|uniref:serine/threonine-protein kinase n=1 Tax=Haliea sp. E1-2-M8 TaxID=3064706 RepID=UPI00271C6456|nr:serine/threonine-protein kinase [Haliea sp. E1-2-M8]MDO8863316.1 serine/threonine-protein kinase [Haliea sp. E1-2-M8]